MSERLFRCEDTAFPNIDALEQYVAEQRLNQGGENALIVTIQNIAALEQQRNDIEDALAELNAGCAWLEERLADREPSEDIKRRAAAFEALASARLTQWSGHSPDDPT